MGATMGPPSFRGRNIGIVILVALQILVGIIHLVFGFWFVVASPDIYGIYTTVFSVLTYFLPQAYGSTGAGVG
jgi:hypothetical protein